MKLSFFNILVLVVLSGCATKYVEPLPTQPTAQIKFERDSKSPALGSTTLFVALDDTFSCNPLKGFMKQKKMATIDKGNPLIKNENNGAIRVPVKENFRLLVKTIAGFSNCDVVLCFKSERNKNYKLKAITDMKSKEISCSVVVSELNFKEETEVTFIEYEECKTS